jgi:hypothetical protein
MAKASTRKTSWIDPITGDDEASAMARGPGAMAGRPF